MIGKYGYAQEVALAIFHKGVTYPVTNSNVKLSAIFTLKSP